MRCSTTTIESFRLFMDPDQEWMSEADLLATIKGAFTPTPEILLGRAFDAVLNDPDACRVDGGYRFEDHFFDASMMAPALEVFDRRGVFQVKGTKTYDDCTVVAVADQLVGATVVENKTTLKAFDFDKYAASCQWRFLADMFTPARVTYHIFLLGQDDAGTVLRGIETFSLYPYEELHQDCAALVRRFAAYVRGRGLEPLLQARQARADARADVPV